MSKDTNPTVLLGKDKEAQCFLKKHADDPVIGGGFTACLPYDNFTKVLSFERKPIVDALVLVMRQLSPKEQKLAKMFLRMPPRDIVKKLRVRPTILYDRLRALREKALRLAAERRNKYTNQRSKALTPDLDTEPSRIARRVIRLTLNEKEAHVYQIERDGDRVWVDDSGQALARELQDVLDNINEDAERFEILHAEEV